MTRKRSLWLFISREYSHSCNLQWRFSCNFNFSKYFSGQGRFLGLMSFSSVAYLLHLSKLQRSFYKITNHASPLIHLYLSRFLFSLYIQPLCSDVVDFRIEAKSFFHDGCECARAPALRGTRDQAITKCRDIDAREKRKNQ